MRAIVCHTHGEPEVMQYESVPLPELSPHDVLIRSAAIGVNYVDLMRRSGQHPRAPKVPFTPGIEVCGVVADVGEQVTRFRVGDRVIGRCVTHGSYAEFVRVEERFTVECPAGLSDLQGAAVFVTGQTAYHALTTMGRLQPDEWVLITAAAGGVGSCAVQIARLLGARVLAAAGTPEKCQQTLELGATASVDYSQTDWPRKVREITSDGADLIIESVGGDIGSRSSECWAEEGRMVVFGEACGRPLQLSGDTLLFGHRNAQGMAVGRLIENETLMRATMQQLTDWVAGGHLQLPVGREYSLADASAAHHDLASRATSGKLVLIP